MKNKNKVTEATIEAPAKDIKTLKANNAIGKDDTVKVVPDDQTSKSTSTVTPVKPMYEQGIDAVIEPQDKETIKYLSNVKDSKTGEVSKPFTIKGKNYQMVRGITPSKEVVMAVFCHDDLDEAGNNIIHPVEHFEENIAKKALAEEVKNNPWAICTASVGREDKDKYERCVMDVKKQHGISEMMTEDEYNADNFNSDERDFHDKENLRATEVPPITTVEKPKEIETGKAECVFEPNGVGGMEGYSAGSIYTYKLFDKDKNGRPYYRVYHDENYYETCGVGRFKKFFKKVNELEETKGQDVVGKEISHLQKDKDYPHKRAVAAALNVAREKGYAVENKSFNLSEYKHFFVDENTGKFRKFKTNNELASANLAKNERYMGLSEFRSFFNNKLFGGKQKSKEVNEIDVADVDQNVKTALQKTVQLINPYIIKLIKPAEKIEYLSKMVAMMNLDKTATQKLVNALRGSSATSFGSTSSTSSQTNVSGTGTETPIAENKVITKNELIETLKPKTILKTVKVKDIMETIIVKDYPSLADKSRKSMFIPYGDLTELLIKNNTIESDYVVVKGVQGNGGLYCAIKKVTI